MAVKKRYKQTEAGVIPEDWKVRPIREISNPVRGGSPRPAGDPRFFDGNFIPWLTVAALTNIPSSQLKVSHTDSCLTEEGSLRSRILYPGTLILANSGATLGVAKILGIKCCANDGIAALLNFNATVSTTYLVHYINTRTQYLRDVVATGNGQPNLNTDLIGNFKIPLPPTLAEQEAIAGALSDADAWIESLEQLIAKKRQIKQGAMQELLTGKRRLPGFSGKWETKRLGDHCRFLRNGTNSRADLSVDGPLKYLHYGDIHSCNNVYMSPKLLPSLPMSKANTLDRLQDGDLVLADASEDTIGISKSVEIVGVDSFELVAGLHTIAVRFSTGLFAPKFVGFLQHCPDFNLHLRKLAAGTKVFATNRRHVSSAEVCVPPLKEQTAIATVLLDMDTEIGSLESKLVKAREIKQGMMQELLTGKIRLV
jgi:type I restriction enzyme S subunit